MPTTAFLLRRLAAAGWTVPTVSLSLAAALVAVGWFDYATTRREFVRLLEAHAASVRETVGAAARANLAAAEDMQAQMGARLLDNARLLAELDRLQALTEPAISEIAARNRLFRVTLFDRSGTRQLSVGPTPGGGPGVGRGQGGPGRGLGPGAGGGPLVDRLIGGGESEAVTDLHEGRREGMARLSAGVRRGGGGAIVLNVDATEVADLRRQATLDDLLDDIVQSAGDVAYVVFESAGVRRTAGDAPSDAQGATPEARAPDVTSRPASTGGVPVLELSGPVDLGGSGKAEVRLGMRLDGLRRAEQRTLSRLAVSLGAAVALGVLAVGLVWLRQQYGSLSLEHARAQEALQRRDRLAAMGELASSVAHEVRNPLNAIAMSAQRLRKEWLASDNADPDSVALVDVIQHESQRINRTVQQFLEFARPPALQPRAVPLGPWLAGIADAVRPLAESRGLALHTEFADLGEAVIDPDQLRQAIDNLLRNAIDATPAGGRITLGGSRAGPSVVLEVADTGAGIPPDVLPKIFDLYFTTKADGTGIGLPITQQLVGAHGGRIDVTSARGQGTTMRVTLPATPDEVIDA